MLIDANLNHAGLDYANLTGAYLGGANLYCASLIRACLARADVRDANLSFACLVETDLKNAVLWGTNLNNARFQETDLTLATLTQTVLTSVDLRAVRGLDRANHGGPSSIGIDTLYLSQGYIPDEFLRGAGVPEDVITNLLPLIRKGPTIQWYSCFISHSTRDKQFADLLYARLKAQNVRVYYAPEDLKGGDKLLDQLERAIHVNDRLLLVLSDHSILSEWVNTEVRRAHESGRKQGRRKLFPIRLTDFRTLEEWKCPDSKSGQDLAEEVRQYFIPDLSNWKNHDAFEQAFDRLLRDLKAEETSR